MAVTGAPPAAEAQTVDAGRYFPVEGPRLAGDEVVWIPAYRTDRFQVDIRAVAGGPTRTIFEMLSTPGQHYGVVVNDLAASPQQVLVQQGLPEGFEDREVIRIGDDGTVEALGEGSPNIERQIDLSGNVGIYNGSGPGATIRDFGTPGSEPVLVSPVAGQMRVAGRYAAWEAGGDIVVYDRSTNSEAYRIPDLWPGIYDDKSLDLQADGKVAFYFAERGPFRARVAWASPAEPFAHRLPVRDDGSYMVKMDNDRVVFVRDKGRRLTERPGLVTRTGELGMVGLTGGERVLARPVESSAFGEFFDFDGGRVAWQERTCQGAQLRVQTLDALIARPRLRSVVHPRRCRLRLRKDARYQRRKDLLPFLVDCTGFRQDCVTLDPVLRTLRAYRVNGRRIPKGTRVSDGTIEVTDPQDVTDTQDAFEITPVGRRLILRPGRIRFGIRTYIADTLVAEHRRGRITVR